MIKYMSFSQFWLFAILCYDKDVTGWPSLFMFHIISPELSPVRNGRGLFLFYDIDVTFSLRSVASWLYGFSYYRLPILNYKVILMRFEKNLKKIDLAIDFFLK